MEFITSKYLKENNDEFIVVDIRDEVAFKSNTVPESVNIDVYSDIKRGYFEIARKKLSILPMGKKIVTVCNAGVTAQKASQILQELGYESAVLQGGMIRWNSSI